MNTTHFTTDQIKDIEFGVNREVKTLGKKARDLMNTVKEASSLTELPAHTLRDLAPTKEALDAFQGLQARIELAQSASETEVQKVLRSTRHILLSQMMWEQDADRLAVIRRMAEVFRDADAL